MNIPISIWHYVKDYPGASLNMTSSALTASFSGSYHTNFDNVDVTAKIEVTNSVANTQQVVTYTFNNLPVVSYSEFQSGSNYYELISVQRPNIKFDKLQQDGITIKLKDITQINFDQQGVQYYISFIPQTPPWSPISWK